jgi:hypothetical protein
VPSSLAGDHPLVASVVLVAVTPGLMPTLLLAVAPLAVLSVVVVRAGLRHRQVQGAGLGAAGCPRPLPPSQTAWQ